MLRMVEIAHGHRRIREAGGCLDVEEAPRSPVRVSISVSCCSEYTHQNMKYSTLSMV
jgi:hypothetical protein